MATPMPPDCAALAGATGDARHRVAAPVLSYSENDGTRVNYYRSDKVVSVPVRLNTGAWTRIILLVASLYATTIGTAHAGRPVCPGGTTLPPFWVVRDQVWTECDCVHAKSARIFRRCYRAGVWRRGTEVGWPDGCIRELLTPEFVRSTCGRPKAVVCCTQRKIYGYRPEYCAVKPSAKRCVAPRSGKACISVGQEDCFSGIGAASNCGCIEQ